jgi:biopolymer transport protein ExbD
MRPKALMLVLAPFLCTTAAFAVEKISVDVPFSFESHGQQFPANRYDITLNDDLHLMTIRSTEFPAKSMSLMVTNAEIKAGAPQLSIRFENAGNTHELRSIRLGGYQAKVSGR